MTSSSRSHPVSNQRTNPFRRRSRGSATVENDHGKLMRTTIDKKDSAPEFRPATGAMPVRKPRMPARPTFQRADIDDPESIALVSLVVVLILGAFLIS